jgi:hypothetical protein
VIEDDGYEEDAEARYERAHDPGGEDPYVTQAKRDAVRRVLELVERERTAPTSHDDLYQKIVDALEIGEDP